MSTSVVPLADQSNECQARAASYTGVHKLSRLGTCQSACQGKAGGRSLRSINIENGLVKPHCEVELAGLEPATSWVRSRRSREDRPDGYLVAVEPSCLVGQWGYSAACYRASESPTRSKQLLLLEHALGVLGQRHEQLVLLRREMHRLAADAYDSRREVNLEVAHGQARVPRPVRASQDGTHAGEQLVVDERPTVRGFAARAALFGPILVDHAGAPQPGSDSWLRFSLRNAACVLVDQLPFHSVDRDPPDDEAEEGRAPNRATSSHAYGDITGSNPVCAFFACRRDGVA
jgi:hypothetical protein